MSNQYKIQLEKLVLELQQRYQKAQFRAEVVEKAGEYFQITLIQRRKIAEEYKSMFELAQELYDEANRC